MTTDGRDPPQGTVDRQGWEALPRGESAREAKGTAGSSEEPLRAFQFSRSAPSSGPGGAMARC